MIDTLALTAALLLSPVGVHSTTPADTSTDGVEQCELFGYRAYAHRVTAGEMDAGMWDELVGNGWSLGFTGPTSPVLVSPLCN